MIEWKKMSNFAAGIKATRLYTPAWHKLRFEQNKNTTDPFHLRFKSVSSPFRILERDKPIIGIRASVK